MVSLGGVEAYMEQWLKTATKGNVRFTMASLTNRMHLHCDVCNIGMTTPKPTSAFAIDYAVQEYVKLHAHTGGHGDEWQCKLCGRWTKEPLTGSSGHGTTCQGVVPAKWKPVTMDFKTPGKVISLTDAQLAKKIQQLQIADKQVLQSGVGAIQLEVDTLVEEAKFDDAAKLNEELAKKTATLRKLELAELAEINAKIKWAQSQLNQVPTVIPHEVVKPVSAPVSDVFEDKGRKFR